MQKLNTHRINIVMKDQFATHEKCREVSKFMKLNELRQWFVT